MQEVPGSIPVAGEEVSEHASLSFVSFAGMTWTHCIDIRIGELTGGPDTQEIQLFESLYKWSRSHDQDGRHAHVW